MLFDDSLCQATLTTGGELNLSPADVFFQWRNSPSHLAPTYQQILASGASDVAKAMPIFFLLYLDHHGDQRLARHQRQAVAFSKLRQQASLWPDDWADFYRRYRFQGIRANVTQALLLWHQSPVAAELQCDVPLPLQVLKLQCRGIRPVGICRQWDQRRHPIRDHGSCFEFMAHDLEHLHNFLHNSELHTTQVGFFRWLLASTRDTKLLHSRQHAWEYLISDMNTHPLHSLAALCALNAQLPLPERLPWHGSYAPWANMPAPAREELLQSPQDAHQARPHLLAYWRQLGQLPID